MYRYRYSEWDGSQDSFDLDADALMEKLGDDLLTHGNLSDMLRRMQRNGLRDNQGRRLPGIEQMRERLRQMKQRQLNKYNLDSVVDEIRQKLAEILDKEKQGIQKRVDEAKQKAAETNPDVSPEVQQSLLKKIEDMAAKNRQKLDELPDDMGGQIKELSSYDFMDEEARQEFKELMDMLKKQAMESYGKDLVQSLKNMDPAAIARMKEMLQALNQMMEQKMRGQEPDFADFMSKFGDFFGPNPPRNFDELMERLQQQMAQAQSLMDSLSPEARQELQDLMQSMLDSDTQNELAKLAMNMEGLFPGGQMGEQYPFSGDESLSHNEAMRLMEMLQKMDKLDDQFGQSQHDQSLDGIDEQLLKDLMGDEAARNLKQLQEISKALEEAGYIRRNHGQWELTPRGLRKIGEKALRDIFAQLNKDRSGSHNMKLRGLGGDKTEETKKYEPGDDFDIDLQKTIMNSIKREGASLPVKLSIDDFEINKREGLTRTAVVILLDMSLSMFMNGYFDAAKRTAIALDTLMRGQFPKDSLHIVGFSLYARELKTKDLFYIRGGFEQGTNLQHGLHLATKLLTKERCTNTQIMLITDGEPTAHIEGSRTFFQYPPTMRTLQATLAEVKRCTQKGIVINTFMFDNTQFTSNFVDRMAQLNKGRVFFADADNLGEYVLYDYVARKKKTIF